MPATSLIAPGTSDQEVPFSTIGQPGTSYLFLYTAGGGVIPDFTGTIKVEREDPNGNWSDTGLRLNAQTPQLSLDMNSGVYRINRSGLSAPIGICYEPLGGV